MTTTQRKRRYTIHRGSLLFNRTTSLLRIRSRPPPRPRRLLIRLYLRLNRHPLRNVILSNISNRVILIRVRVPRLVRQRASRLTKAFRIRTTLIPTILLPHTIGRNARLFKTSQLRRMVRYNRIMTLNSMVQMTNSRSSLRNFILLPSHFNRHSAIYTKRFCVRRWWVGIFVLYMTRRRLFYQKGNPTFRHSTPLLYPIHRSTTRVIHVHYTIITSHYPVDRPLLSPLLSFFQL